MTTMYPREIKCNICKKISEHIVIGSTNTLGSPDLDVRPSEMKRSTINMQIQICPSCGYCAPDISEQVQKASEVICGDSYQQQFNSPKFSKIANAFLCSSLIQERVGEYATAGWAAIYAAWICDDEHSDAAARECRKRAISLLQKAKEKGQRFANQDETGLEEAIIIDLLRRSGKFELALMICDQELKKNPKEIILHVLQFQKVLINKSDIACHTIAEALGENE